MRSTQAGLQKALEDHFGPSSPQTKKSLEKKRGFPFPIRTKQSIDDSIFEGLLIRNGSNRLFKIES
jgi:hypothetical protein